MNYKNRAIYIVLFIGLLTTVATSAPADFYLDGQGEMTFAGPTTVRALVTVNRDAIRHADQFQVEFELQATLGGPFMVQVVPDDPTREVQSVSVDAGGTAIAYYDAISSCDGENACEFGVSFDIPADVAMRIAVHGTLTAYGDPSFFFPENREFPASATIAVGFNDASAAQ